MSYGQVLLKIAFVVGLMLSVSASANQTKPKWPPENHRGTVHKVGPQDKGKTVRPAQRLSPEERRQLRRDIRNAGREIYPPTD